MQPQRPSWMEQRPVLRSHCSVLTVRMATSSKTLIKNFPGSISPRKNSAKHPSGAVFARCIPFPETAESSAFGKIYRLVVLSESFFTLLASILVGEAGLRRWRHAAETWTRGQVTYEGSKE